MLLKFHCDQKHRFKSVELVRCQLAKAITTRGWEDWRSYTIDSPKSDVLFLLKFVLISIQEMMSLNLLNKDIYTVWSRTSLSVFIAYLPGDVR
jgi:hypothetical protein